MIETMGKSLFNVLYYIQECQIAILFINFFKTITSSGLQQVPVSNVSVFLILSY